MDYGSLYGMGSYYGEDYTAYTLVRLGTVTKEQWRRAGSARRLETSPPTSRQRSPRRCSGSCKASI